MTLSKALSQFNRRSDQLECCLSARSNNLLAIKIACAVDFLVRKAYGVFCIHESNSSMRRALIMLAYHMSNSCKRAVGL